MKTKTNKKSLTIPKFATEEAERKFWATHDSTKYFAAMAELDKPIRDARPAKKAISIRVDEPALVKLKSVAAKKGLGYQTLMRMWLLERLDQEAARR